MSEIEPVYGIFGKWVQQQRNDAGLTLEELAEKFGLSPETFASIEAGQERVLLHVYNDIRKYLEPENVNWIKRRRLMAQEARERKEAEAREVHERTERVIAFGREIAPAYTGGATVQELAAQHNTSVNAVYHALRLAEVPRRRVGASRGFRDQERTNKIIALYTEHEKTLEEIGAEFGISKQRVEQILRKGGIKRQRTGGRIAEPLSPLEIRLMEDYEAGLRPREIREKHHMDEASFYAIFPRAQRRWTAEKRKKGELPPKQPRNTQEYQEIVSDAETLDFNEVTTHMGVVRTTIYNWINDRGFPHPIASGGKKKLWSKNEVNTWIRKQQKEA